MRLVRLYHPLRIATPVAAVALFVLASAAGAFDLRAPQVGFCSASLHSYLTSVGENAINVAADQVDGQVWSSTASGNAEFTLQIELAGNAAQNTIGVYNTDDVNPTLFQVFPGAASHGWYATIYFAVSGSLTVQLYDNHGAYQGGTVYAGVNRNKFGFYLQGPGGMFYSQDSRNGGKTQILTYAGTGNHYGSWWQCFEDLRYQYPNCLTDFEDAVLYVERVNPVPARGLTWGAVKGLYDR
jgi:hypothetical protein